MTTPYASMQITITPTDRQMGQVSINTSLTEDQFNALMAAHRARLSFVEWLIAKLRGK